MEKKSNWFEATIQFKVDGKKVNFKVYHNISQVEGPVNTIDAALDSWFGRTSEFTAKSFVAYINSKGIYKAYTEEEWNKMLKS